MIGEALFSQTPLTYLAFVTVALVAWVLYRTPLGLAVRAAGENPSAVEAQGISVTAIRMGAVMAGSALMAIGGAFLTMSAFNSFFFEMINGRGWICIALVVFGSWRPGKALLGAILFAAFDAYQVRLQQLSGGVVPYQIFLMMPYVLSILALVLVAPPRDLPEGADDPLPERRKMSFDLIVRAASCPTATADIGIHGEKIAAIEPSIQAEAGRSSTPPAIWSRRPSSIRISTWTRRLSYGIPRINASGTLLEGIALWGELKPLLTHEAVTRARARLLRLGRLDGPARHPHPCRCLRRPAARRRSAARGEEGRSRPISTCSSSPSRRTASTARRRRAKTPSARSTWASTSSAASRISSAPWPTARAPSPSFARSPPSAA